MAKSTTSRPSRKPPKPQPDFPLFAHAAGYWSKKVRGRTVYFGSWKDDPKGQRALEQWAEQKDDLLAGRTPHSGGDGLTVKNLVNNFLTFKQDLLMNGKIVPRTFVSYKKTCERLVDFFDRDRRVDDLAASDFRKLRAAIAETRGPAALGNEITVVRMVFKFAFDEHLIERPVRYGQSFAKPSKKVLRKNRAANGIRMFEANEIRLILDNAQQPLRTMCLLAINAGCGNSDVSGLPRDAVDLENGWLNYPRPKTGVARRVPLWIETLESLQDAIDHRPEPADPADAVLVFLTKYGNRWVKNHGSSDDSVAKEFSKLLKRLGINGKRGFYALRHTTQTIGEEAGETATRHIMGHTDNSMSAVYRERISDERLQAVANHIHQWLWPVEEGGEL